MGEKSLFCTKKLREFCRTASEGIQPSRRRFRQAASSESDRPEQDTRGMEESEQRLPLSDVVSDCVKRWFHDTLKEARAGDIAMQVLVGQMYNSGYGVPRNAQKGKVWITRASQNRSAVWKVSNKRPGYNASDSDSEEVKNDLK